MQNMFFWLVFIYDSFPFLSTIHTHSYVQHVTTPRSCAAASASSAAFGLPAAPRPLRALRAAASASRPKAPGASAWRNHQVPIWGDFEELVDRGKSQIYKWRMGVGVTPFQEIFIEPDLTRPQLNGSWWKMVEFLTKVSLMIGHWMFLVVDGVWDDD